jgi:cell division protein ZapB
MDTEAVNDVAEQELKKLEFRIGELIDTCERLKAENRRLREEHASLSAERSKLAEKNAQAKVRVESIITRLKSMELA